MCRQTSNNGVPIMDFMRDCIVNFAPNYNRFVRCDFFPIIISRYCVRFLSGIPDRDIVSGCDVNTEGNNPFPF